MNQSAVPVLRSEGQRMLLHVTGSLKAIALAIGSQSPQSVHNWRTGRKSPGPDARAQMYAAFGIPPRAWEMRPGSDVTPPSAAAVTTIEADDDLPPSALEHCMQLLRVISRERRAPDLLSSERVKLTDAEARLLALRDRLESKAELSEDRFVREHPAWLRLRKRMVQVLVAHPAAAQALAAALADLDM